MSGTRDPLAVLGVWDRLEVGPVRVEPRKLVAPYTVVGRGRRESIDLVYRYEEDVFDPRQPDSMNLAAMICAQVALNYGLFCDEIVFRGPFDDVDRRFLIDMAENTAREIYVLRLLQPNPFLRGDVVGLQAVLRERYCRARLVFDGHEPGPPVPTEWAVRSTACAILSSGGKDSLLGYGLLDEIGVETHPLFVNESGRHWYTALNAYRYFRENVPNTARVWTNADRVFCWALRQLPFVRPNFHRVRSDEYPIRLWTVAVFLFGVLPLLGRRGVGRLVIGNEHDTTSRATYRDILHYGGLYDQSRYFDERLTRYFDLKGWNVEQFSLLRSLSELLIEKLLSERYPDLLVHQTSCHATHIDGDRVRPCGQCEKCRRVVGMLTAIGRDPSVCGYDEAQVEGCLKELALAGAHQEAAGVEQLLFMLRGSGTFDGLGVQVEGARERPEILKLRVHPERSPVECIPQDLRDPLFDIFKDHVDGSVRWADSGWIDDAWNPYLDLTSLEEVNVVEHPFRHELRASHDAEYTDFSYRYFDDPATLTGFGGYRADGSKAEGRRDFCTEARRIASIPGVRSVLDVGCAKGYLVCALRERGVDARGIDVSRYAIECADPKIRPYLRVLDARELPSAERYDLVHACGILAYLELSDLRAVLQRLHAVARLGAMFDELTLERVLSLYDRGDPRAIDPLRKQELPEQVWEALFREAGFVQADEYHRKVLVPVADRAEGTSRLNGQRSTLRGLLIPMEWDEHDNPRRLALCTADERDLFIEEGPLWDGLLEHLAHEVWVRGTVHPGPSGTGTIDIHRFERIDWDGDLSRLFPGDTGPDLYE